MRCDLLVGEHAVLSLAYDGGVIVPRDLLAFVCKRMVTSDCFMVVTPFFGRAIHASVAALG